MRLFPLLRAVRLRVLGRRTRSGTRTTSWPSGRKLLPGGCFTAHNYRAPGSRRRVSVISWRISKRCGTRLRPSKRQPCGDFDQLQTLTHGRCPTSIRYTQRDGCRRNNASHAWTSFMETGVCTDEKHRETHGSHGRFVGSSVFAADWPWIYGPDGTAPRIRRACSERGRRGSEGALDDARERGFGGPAVSADKSTCSTGTNRSGTSCACSTWPAARSSGALRTMRPAPSCLPARGPHRRSTARHVYTSGPLGDLHAINTKTRKPVWHKNIWKDFGGGELPRWAVVQNPLIYGNLLIVAPQTSQAGVVAYDKLTGELKWKSAPLSGTRRIREPIDHQGRRRRPSGHDHGRGGTRTQREGWQRQRPRPAHREGALDVHELAVHHPGSPARRRR